MELCVDMPSEIIKFLGVVWKSVFIYFWEFWIVVW